MKPKVKLPEAAGVCNICLEKQTVTNGNLIVSYCEHNHAGAVMMLKDGEPVNSMWTIYSPISAEEFADAVSSAVAFVEKKPSFNGGKKDLATFN